MDEKIFTLRNRNDDSDLVAWLEELTRGNPLETESNLPETADATLSEALEKIEREEEIMKLYATQTAVAFTGQPAPVNRVDLMRRMRQRPSEAGSALRSEAFGWRHYARIDPADFTEEEIQTIRKERHKIQKKDSIWRKRKENDGWTPEQIAEGMAKRRAKREAQFSLLTQEI